MNNNSSKQVLLSVIGVAILVVAVVGVSFAFFSYVYNGQTANTVQTGTIVFTASDDALTLTNVFPTTSTSADYSKHSATATVSVQGSTTYEAGIQFTVRATEVQNASTATGTSITEQIYPRVVVAPREVTNVSFSEGYTGSKTYGNGNNDMTILAANTTISKGVISGAGVATSTPILDITVYYDMDDYHISDNTNAQLATAGLLAADYETNGGNIISTTDWNALAAADAAYSFKIQVTAVENGSADPRITQ